MTYRRAPRQGRKSRGLFALAAACVLVLAVLAGCDGSAGTFGSIGGNPGSGGGLFERQEQAARYTIFLLGFEGPEHVSEARRYKASTEQQAGWRDVYAVHKDSHSDLFRGRYPSLEAATRELQNVKAFRSDLGVQVYPAAMVMPLPGRDVGPEKWNLKNVPPPAAYTVLVAYFYDVPEANYVGREDFAVEYCRQLRDEGWEAYFRHRPERSEVTVGTFGSAAYRAVREGHVVRREVTDPAMQRVLDHFEYLAVNGRRQRILEPDVRTKKAYWVDQKSHPIPIPREEPDDGLGSYSGAGYP